MMTLNDGKTTRTLAVIAVSNLFCLSANPVFANHSDLRLNRQEARISRAERLSERIPRADRLNDRLPKVERLNVNNLSNFLPVQRVNLDLSSRAANIVLDARLFRNANSITIDVGGQMKTLESGASVTAAEYVAARQMLTNGSQSLRLDDQGTATGGSFVLNSLVSNRVSGLVVPEAVTGIDYFSNNRRINIGGDLVNNGSIYGVTTDRKITEGVINARGDIINNAGAVISTQAPNSLRGVFDGQDLTLEAGNNLTNSGRINASGNLTLIANTIVNGQSSSQQDATIIAGQDLNLQSYSGDIVNGASMTALRGDINVASLSLSQDLNINAQNGTFSAKKGDINIRDVSYTGSGNTDLVGGNYLSNNLNIYSGTGQIEANVGNVSGKLNSSAQIEHFIAATDVLTLGDNCITGDPTFANTAGDIVINGGVTAAEAISILASGSITALGDAFISTANSTGATSTPSTAITLIAGAKVTTDGTPTTGIPTPGGGIGAGKTATVDFSTGKGGNIDLSGSTHKGPIINTSSTLAGSGNQQANGGNVMLAAFSASSKNGNILFPTSQVSIDASSDDAFAGNVTIIAGGSSTKTPAISLGNIDTTWAGGGSGSPGSVTIASAQPTASTGTTITFDSSGNASTGIKSSPAKGLGSIVINNIDAGDANVSIATGGKGGITQASGEITGANVDLAAGTAGIGIDASNRISSNAVSVLTANSTGNVFLHAVGGSGGFDLGASSAGSKSTFDLKMGANGNGDGRINLNGDLSGGTVNLTSSEFGSGQAGIRQNSGTIFATNVNLIDIDNDGVTPGYGDFGTPGTRLLMQAVNLSANTGGDLYITNTGPLTLGASSAGGFRTFDIQTVADAKGNGTITLAGNIATSDPVDSIANLILQSDENGKGKGGIISNGASIAATNVTLRDKSTLVGTGSFGSSKSFIQTIASTLNLNTAGSVFVSNTGSVVVGNSSAGDGKEFNLKTVADVSGNGAITLSQINAATGTIDSIKINSTESGAGSGGITQPSSTLTADTVTLLDGLNGLGNGNIGQGAGSRVNTTAANLSVNTTGSVFINNTGPVTLGSSSAGDKRMFNINVTPDSNGNGAITLAGNVKAATGIITTIALNSNESGLGVGGINGGKKAILFADNVALLDAFSGGNGNIGTTKTAIQLSGTTNLLANTLGSVNINNVAAASVDIKSSQAINGSFSVTSAGNITTTGSIIHGLGINLESTAKNGGIILGASLIATGPGTTSTLIATGTGSVVQSQSSGDSISSEFVIIDVDSGTVGTAGNALRLSTNNLSIENGSLVKIANSGPLDLAVSKATGDFTLSNSGDLKVNGAITSATAIDLSTLSGSILINANLGSTKTTSTVSLDSGGSGNITTLNNKVVVAAKTNVHLRSGGSIGSGTTTATALTVSTPGIDASTNGSGSININDIGKAATTLGGSSAGGGFILNAASSLTLNSLFVDNGNVSLTGKGDLVKTNPGAFIQLGTPGQKASTGGITIANLNTSKGNIELGAGTILQTNLSTPGATNGTINVVIGAVPIAPVAGTTPSGVTVNKTAGTAFFGVNGITATGSNTINLIGANVVFNTGKQDASHISLLGGVVITADPPIIQTSNLSSAAETKSISIAHRHQGLVSISPKALFSLPIKFIPTVSGSTLTPQLVTPAVQN